MLLLCDTFIVFPPLRVNIYLFLWLVKIWIILRQLKINFKIFYLFLHINSLINQKCVWSCSLLEYSCAARINVNASVLKNGESVFLEMLHALWKKTVLRFWEKKIGINYKQKTPTNRKQALGKICGLTAWLSTCFYTVILK